MERGPTRLEELLDSPCTVLILKDDSFVKGALYGTD